MITRKQIIGSIASTVLEIDTLEVRDSDRLDFHLLAVWQIKEALEAAFEAGRRAVSA